MARSHPQGEAAFKSILPEDIDSIRFRRRPDWL